MTDLYDELRSRNPLHQVVARYTRLSGSASTGWRGKCPIHRETKGEAFSVYIADDGVERWKCHGKCGMGGDVVDFLREMGQDPIREGSAPTPRTAPRPSPETVTLQPVVVPPPAPLAIEPGKAVTGYSRKTERQLSYTPSRVFEYISEHGELLGYVLRIDSQGRKQFRTLQHTDKGWAWLNFVEPMPLYGLHRLAQARQVVLVEGEGKADDLQAIAPKGVAVLGLYQGSSSVQKMGLAPLIEAKLPVILWPDHDEVGVKAMREVGFALREHCGLCLITPEADRPAGWDAADLVAELKEWPLVKEWIRAHKAEPTREWLRGEPAEPIRLDAKRPKLELITTQQERPEVTQLAVIETEWRPLTSRPTTADCVSRVVGKEVEDAKGVTRTRPAPENPYNWRVYLHYHPTLWNVFARSDQDDAVWLVERPPWSRDPNWQRCRFDADQLQQLVVYLSGLGLKVKPAPLDDLVAMHAGHVRRFNALTDRLRELANEWDGVPRLLEWAQTYLGAPDIEITKHMARRWLIGAVARAFEPGCKMDNVLLLEGEQGIGKSEVFKILCRAAGSISYYEENIEHLDPQKVYSLMRGVWIAEIAEMSAYNKKDAAEWKKFVTRQDDNHRKLFTDQKMQAPRRFVLGATINPDGAGYLNDPTGSRRIWPILCLKILFEALIQDAPQLLGEAAYEYLKGEPWYLTPEEEQLAKVEQAERTADDPLLAQLAGMLETPEFRNRSEVAPYEIMIQLGVPSDRRDERLSRRIGSIMKKLGWANVQTRRHGTKVRVYVRSITHD